MSDFAVPKAITCSPFAEASHRPSQGHPPSPLPHLDAAAAWRYARRMLTGDSARAYVQRWSETGRLLEEQRWAELAALSEADALRASDMLLDAAQRVPLPASRRTWSGLVAQQDLFHRGRS